MPPLEELIRSLPETAWTDVPLPGSGQTAQRHQALLAFGRTDLSLARIAEAHLDALSILAAAGRVPRPGALYGVWASESPNATVTARPTADGAWQLDGLKQYCSGATLLSAALVTARVDEGVLLFDIALSQSGIRVEASNWQTPAFADTATGPVSFAAVIVSSDRLVGGTNWYLTRPGFWHGAVGPAACWAGGALALVDAAIQWKRRDAHARANVGAMQATAWAMHAYLDKAAAEIDADPEDCGGEAQIRALSARHLIERSCTEIMDRFGRATGPQLLAYDGQIARQYAALTLYIRQCHAERDLEIIAAAPS
jgi:alkylation response protein AidB-like acyl-CoA dehydrogenase